MYASYIVNMDATRMPRANGSYFTVFNDGSANTANVEGCVVAATNGAAALGFYRLGIAKCGGDRNELAGVPARPGSGQQLHRGAVTGVVERILHSVGEPRRSIFGERDGHSRSGQRHELV